jgi:hypothetical protein
VSALDAKIDDLYKLPLSEFTSARNALAKTLGKDDGAKIVKALEKPTVVPWAVNQVYWRAPRLVFELKHRAVLCDKDVPLQAVQHAKRVRVVLGDRRDARVVDHAHALVDRRCR